MRSFAFCSRFAGSDYATRDLTLEDGTLRINGTVLDDSVTVRVVDGQYRVRADFLVGDLFFDPDLITKIEVRVLDGNDMVAIGNDITEPVLIVGGPGDDELIGGGGDDTIQGNAGADVIKDAPGADHLFGNAGADTIRGGSEDDFVDGGYGNDTIAGDKGFDILLGGPGNDKVQGIAGRDVIIGGDGRDTLRGGGGTDLIIAGATVYDDDSAALDLIMAEWSTGSVNQAGYDRRVDHLRNGTGSILEGTGVRLAANDTVFDDGVADSLLEGGGALDWFFADLDGLDGDDDLIIDLQPGEAVDILS